MRSEDLQSFSENGFLKVESLVSRDTVLAIKRQIETYLYNPNTSALEFEESSPYIPRKLHRLIKDENDEVLRQNVVSPELLEIVTILLGDNPHLYQDGVFLKRAQFGSPKAYHQDISVWIKYYTHTLSCWVALDDATIENACLVFIPGSHTWGLLSEDVINAIRKSALMGDYKCAEIPVQAKSGDVLFFSGLTLHASHHNHSKSNRMAYSLEFGAKL